MKFADLEVLHQKFFAVTQSGERSKSDWWARERLRLLKQHGFLNSKRLNFSGKGYYLATDLAHTVLTNMRSQRSFVRPLAEIDLRTFEHDRLIIAARLALETAGRAVNWASERRLKSESALTAGLPRMYQPDAIYWNKHGEPMAFELEISGKARARYEIKIRKYLEVIRRSEGAEGGFRGVLFVVHNAGVFELLTELTRRFEGKFKIEKFDNLVGQSRPQAEREVV